MEGRNFCKFQIFEDPLPHSPPSRLQQPKDPVAREENSNAIFQLKLARGLAFDASALDVAMAINYLHPFQAAGAIITGVPIARYRESVSILEKARE